MYKISSQVIDFYDDQSLLLDILGEEAPEAIKKAHIMSYEQQQEMPDDEFAVVVLTKTGHKLRKYPISDKGHTWLSCESFKKTAHKLPHKAAEVAASNLYSSCVYHDIECPGIITKLAAEISTNVIDVDESEDLPMEYYLEEKLANRRAETVAEDEWGIVDGGRKMYPLNTKPNVEAAVTYFQKHAEDILPGFKRELACGIVKQAEKFDVSVPGGVTVYANVEAGDKCYSNIMSRVPIVKTAMEKKVAMAIASECEKHTAGNLIDMLKDFDKLAGMEKYYGRHIKDPYLTVLEKSAGIARNGEDMITDLDIQNYAGGEASTELTGHLPEEVIDRFMVEPLKTFKSIPDIQKDVIKRGITGVIK